MLARFPQARLREGRTTTMTVQAIKQCPIRGCNHVFVQGVRGWYKHVGCYDNHPWWAVRCYTARERAEHFQQAFHDFFLNHVGIRGETYDATV